MFNPSCFNPNSIPHLILNDADVHLADRWSRRAGVSHVVSGDEGVRDGRDGHGRCRGLCEEQQSEGVGREGKEKHRGFRQA